MTLVRSEQTTSRELYIFDRVLCVRMNLGISPFSFLSPKQRSCPFAPRPDPGRWWIRGGPSTSRMSVDAIGCYQTQQRVDFITQGGGSIGQV